VVDKTAVIASGDKKIHQSAMTRLYGERINSKTQALIDEHEKNVRKILPGNYTRSAPISPTLDYEIKDFESKAYRGTAKDLIEFGDHVQGTSLDNLGVAFKDFITPDRPTRMIASEIVLKDPLYKHSTLKGMWGGLVNSERMRIEAAIRVGLDAGDTEEQIIRRVSKTFGLTRVHSESLVITGITSVYAQVDHAVYTANAKYLRGYQYAAILDTRTTPECRRLDGKVFPISDRGHLPPQHYHCRSTTIPVPKKWDDLAGLDTVKQTRARNITGMSEEQIANYDRQASKWFTGNPYPNISYHDWLSAQDNRTQLIHLGDLTRLKMFQNNLITADKFITPKGTSVGLRELRALSGEAGTAGEYNGTVEAVSKTFVNAKDRLDTINLGYTSPNELLNDKESVNKLLEYYKLQSGELNGTLSLTNYRGILPHVKTGTKRRVLTVPPTDEQLIYNPITKRREDARIYQPNAAADKRTIRLVEESKSLTDKDKEFLLSFKKEIQKSVGMNESAVVIDNLRVTIERFRKNSEPWGNLKAILNSEMKNSVTNVSEFIETQLRNNSDMFYKLKQGEYLDPVLGAVQLDDLGKNFIPNIKERNRWENRNLPIIALELRSVLDTFIKTQLPAKIQLRRVFQNIDNLEMQEFYMKFAKRLAMDDAPDRDQLAVGLGRDLYNLANMRGTKREWYDAGLEIVNYAEKAKFYELETFGVKKRRMRSRMSNNYFGQYYDTLSVNLKIIDPRIKRYSYLNRAIDVGYRVGVNEEKYGNVLVVKPGYKTYFTKDGYDTKIPITSTSSFAELPVELIDDNMADALNWYSKSKYKIDPEFYSFTRKLLSFQDDKGKAKYYDSLNHYRDYIAARGDSYERFKSMEHYVANDMAFSNHAFIDHRGRIYDSGLIGPQAGESFRPFLNTEVSKNLGVDGYYNLTDQVGSFLGGLSDEFEGRYNGLTNTGKQLIAQKWRPELIQLGKRIERAKPQDIRDILDSKIVSMVEGEEQGKLFRLALEMYRVDKYLDGDYSEESIAKLANYKISVALEQDASSSGAQIIALTTKNKELAELSNVVPTSQKRRLYDVVAQDTFEDPRFKKINERLGLSEKDLRKGAKSGVMVSLYGAGQRTATLNIEKKLAKALGKQEGLLVLKTEERDAVLSEISARAAKVERWDPIAAQELLALRKQVKEVFDKGLAPGDEIMEELWFLDPKTRDFVEKITRDYDGIVTPDDFATVGKLMSEHMAARTPILTDFTRFFGRLAQDFLTTAKPSGAQFDWKLLLKKSAFGDYKAGAKPNPALAWMLGIDPHVPIKDHVLKRIPGYNPKSTISEILFGVQDPGYRPTGKKFGIKLKAGDIYTDIDLLELGIANKQPKNWEHIPWVNFDGKILEQYYTQRFEEKLFYQDADGNWITNIIQVDNKTEPTWFEALTNKANKVNKIADAVGARTAYAVNGNHSNDATLVKNFHLWGKSQGIPTGTIHDAFFTNAADMTNAKKYLRELYAEAVDKNSVKQTLDLLHERGLPDELYNQYLNEAIDKGIIPVPGRSKIGGKILTEEDILTKADVIKELPREFWKHDKGFYGIG